MITSVSPLLASCGRASGSSPLAASLVACGADDDDGCHCVSQRPADQRFAVRKLLLGGLLPSLLALVSRLFVADGGWLVLSTVPGRGGHWHCADGDAGN